MPECNCQHPLRAKRMAVRFTAWTRIEKWWCAVCRGVMTVETERHFDREDAWQE